MKKIGRKILILALVFLIGFAAYTLISTGFFRNLEFTENQRILKEIRLPGAEDIMVSHSDSFAIISSTDRSEFPASHQEMGGLYYLDLHNGAFTPLLLTDNFNKPFAPHGISMFKVDNTYIITAVNHTEGGDFIEKFLFENGRLDHIETISDDLLISPNDLVMVNKDQFYFTNDHKYTSGLGKFLEEYAGYKGGNVVFYNGIETTTVAKGIAYANGINYDSKRKQLFVSSPRGFHIKVFDVSKDGSLNYVENINCGSGIDNLEFDLEGNIWTGAHPNLLRFKAYSKNQKETSPSEILKITYSGKGNYKVEQIYLEDGKIMSASSVAAPFGDIVLLGNVKGDSFIIIEQP